MFLPQLNCPPSTLAKTQLSDMDDCENSPPPPATRSSAAADAPAVNLMTQSPGPCVIDVPLMGSKDIAGAPTDDGDLICDDDSISLLCRAFCL
ncbi:hypothetical protein DFJ58DRAFT_734571 [Suillus subalutaceus]|uniref:uncharacterized protein n=1 Tax=Suillus subalutaceus TaxID=48586 RepID=UPI001B860291|nr:uncharacterized protein DFJ58DRAFT_734571 [Suillus subalutaceus]KAG1837029.1 hypothetical protein DFJ58DRAFT_734571 [Suillus subalutaceus]